jgi:hypothetical protein
VIAIATIFSASCSCDRESEISRFGNPLRESRGEAAGIRGSGSAELLEEGSLEIEFDYQHGDAAILKAERATSSAAC